MIRVLFRKAFELLTNPVMEPSSFWTHRDRTGMLSCFGAAATFLAGVALVPLVTVFPPPLLNRLRVGRAGAAWAFFAAGELGFPRDLVPWVLAVLPPPPKNENGLGAGAGAFTGAGVGLGAGFEPNSENG